ncbi:MAG: micrococcal nuclease [Frankiaceae bacterium]|nr:micrococcal nuclease [Frankiaceae bacterium]
MALVAAALCGCSQSSAASPPSTASTNGAVPVPRNAQSARVQSIVDGDTMHLVGVGAGPLTGGDLRVRLLEINAPETHGTVECFGPEATETLARLTPVGSTVRVVADRETHDSYGRPLLYIWNADGTFVNEQLVRSGAAVVLFIPPNGQYLPVMRQAEQAARDERAGQWAACQ